MSKHIASIRSLAMAVAIAATACGTLQGATPGRAGVRGETPYDATHLDPGTLDTSAGGAGADNGNQSSGSGPQLVP